MMKSTTNVDYEVDVVYCTDGCRYKMTGHHYIAWSRYGEITAWEQWIEYKLNHRSMLYGSASPGECYFASDADIFVDLIEGMFYGVQIPFLPKQLGLGGPYPSGTVCRSNNTTTACKEPAAEGCPPTGSDCTPTDEVCNVSPIMIDVGAGGYDLTSVDDGVAFDIDADGTIDRTSWTARGSALAFLTLDRNRNGRVVDGSELFGDASPTATGKAANGFEALAQYDGNLDGSITASDAVWPLLRLWVDVNHNGVSEAAELMPIADGNIRELGLDYHWIGKRDRWGNVFRYQAGARFASGANPYYDVFLVKAN